MSLAMLGHYRSCTGTGSAAHTTGNEHHVRTLELPADISSRALLSRLLTYLRLRACAKSFGQLLTDLQSVVGALQML